MPTVAVRLVLAILVSLAIFGLTTTLWHYRIDGPLTNAIDFRTFYCGGWALDAGGDPYLVEPTRTCERAALAIAGFSYGAKNLLGALYLPVWVAAFGVLARLPYKLAVEVWMTLNIVALCIATFVTATLCRVRPILAAIALLASLGYESFFYGQPVPIAVAALTIAALAARKNRVTIVAIALLIASIQLHLALPAALGALLFVRGARRPLVIAAALIAALSLIFYAGLTHEYVTSVLPLQSRAEIENFADQYSLSTVLWKIGVAIPLALKLGTLSYVAMVALGLYVGKRLCDRFDDRAFAILAPSAFVTFGGPYIHAHQIASALPFAFLLATYARGAGARTAFASLVLAIVLLAIPFAVIADEPGVNQFFPHQAYVRAGPFRDPAAKELIEVSYIEREDALTKSNERTPAVQLMWKLPTWFALVVLLTSATALARRAR
jgi:hypothetical protein